MDSGLIKFVLMAGAMAIPFLAASFSAKNGKKNGNFGGNTVQVKKNVTLSEDARDSSSNSSSNSSSSTRDKEKEAVEKILKQSNSVNDFETFFDKKDHRLMWKPKDDIVKASQLYQFMQLVNAKYKLKIDNYHDLWQWSVDNRGKFWGEVWSFTKIISSKPYDTVVDESLPPFPAPQWFKGSLLNFAENLLAFRDDKTALIFRMEGDKKLRKISYKDLYAQVAKCAAAMRAIGVSKNDRVGGYIANCIEAVVAMLAATSIGAIWSSTSPDFGVKGVLDRFTQIKPKIIFSINAVNYNGKTHDHIPKLLEILAGLPDVEKVILIPLIEGAEFKPSAIKNCVSFDDFLSSAPKKASKSIEFEQLPFNHPVYILYSSGTTGLPKCMVHSAGGTLIQHKKEHILQGDLTRNDTIFFFTTTGWMMWNWLVSSLSVGATVVLFDGSPFTPDGNILWDLCDEIGFTIFGTSAKYLQSLQAAGLKPIQTHKLTTVRTILSTGSPLIPESFDYVYRDIKKDVLLGSITGGTDIVSCFAGSNPLSPVYRGEIMSCNLGMDVASYSVKAAKVYDQKGDLVCCKSFPSQPVYFWNDDEKGSRYYNSYFAEFENVWHHGDYVVINSETGGVIVLGRSDATLNPGGVRFGSSEIYKVTEQIPEIADSVVVGQQWQGDERVVLFVKLRGSDAKLDEELIKKIKAKIRSEQSPRHVPSIILQVPDIPHTINGKKVEVAVKKIIHGQIPDNLAALANPDSLNYYKNLAQLKQ